MQHAEREEREEREAEEIEERSSPTREVVYHAISKEGNEELERSNATLAWSGLAAGLSMGFSFLVPALLHAHLPDEKWRPLISTAGYSIGFLLVILGRQQLFTENTLTVILPLLQNKDEDTFLNVVRLWAVVFAANVAGAVVFAFVIARSNLVGHDVDVALHELAQNSMTGSFAEVVLRGVFAGWLIALMVWLLPFAESARVWVIIIITYVVGIGGLSHVIAGSVEGAYLAIVHERTWLEFLVGFLLPALSGNVIGGVTLVAVLGHAQVASEDV